MDKSIIATIKNTNSYIIGVEVKPKISAYFFLNFFTDLATVFTSQDTQYPTGMYNRCSGV